MLFNASNTFTYPSKMGIIILQPIQKNMYERIARLEVII